MNIHELALCHLMRRHRYTTMRLTNDQLKEIVSNGYQAVAWNSDNGDMVLELVQAPIDYESYKALKLNDGSCGDTCVVADSGDTSYTAAEYIPDPATFGDTEPKILGVIESEIE